MHRASKVEDNCVIRYANSVYLSVIWEITALVEWIRGEPLDIGHVLYFQYFQYRTKNEQRLYFLTRSSHTWHNYHTLQFKVQLECDVGWKRHTWKPLYIVWQYIRSGSHVRFWVWYRLKNGCEPLQTSSVLYCILSKSVRVIQKKQSWDTSERICVLSCCL